jgi:hypothetical protein
MYNEAEALKTGVLRDTIHEEDENEEVRERMYK